MTAEFSLAVHGLVYLYHHTGQTISSDALAQNICTNPARVSQFLRPDGPSPGAERLARAIKSGLSGQAQ